MNMKEHILAALKEELDAWETLLSKLSEPEILAPRFDLGWSTKDVMAHLWAWQQITIARLEGGLRDQGPELPAWILESTPEWEEDADRVNAVTFETQHNKSWPEIHQQWRSGYLGLIELAGNISERDLLDGGRYPWLNGYNLAFILLASYDHHQEHFEKLSTRLDQD